MGAGAVRAPAVALLLLVALLAAAAAPRGAARALGPGMTVVQGAKGTAKGARTAGPFPYDAYDRKPRWAKGRRSGGQPDPVTGLRTPDLPALGPGSASMEGEAGPGRRARGTGEARGRGGGRAGTPAAAHAYAHARRAGARRRQGGAPSHARWASGAATRPQPSSWPAPLLPPPPAQTWC
jgi:hypothetical protein